MQSLAQNMLSQQNISTQSYIAVNLVDNSVLAQKNADQTLPIASITKLMTAVVSLEKTSAEQKITLTQDILRPLGHSPTLYSGLSVSATNLLKASLIQSTNDAAEALAFFTGKQKFIDEMNQKARDLGMTNTIFYDTHGLSTQNVSTAADLLKLVNYIYKNHPEILAITKINDFWLPDKTGALLKFQNVNNFYPLSNFVGGKTGYLPQARQTFAGVFNIEGKDVAVVVLYSNNRQADVFSVLKMARNKE